MMRFENPEWFLLFFVLLPVGMFLLWETSKKIGEVALWGGEGNHRVRLAQLGKGAVVTLLVSSLFLAFVNPQLVRTENFVETNSNAEIAIVFDVSRSMEARTDPHAPHRLDRSRDIVLGALPRLRGSEIAILGFTDVFLSYLPFTSNHQLVRETLDHAVAVGSLPIPGSDLEEAFREIGKKFDPGKEEKIILIFSDGEITTKNEIPNEVFEELKKEGITLVAVGVGEPEGATIPIMNTGGEFTGRYVISRETGQPFSTRLNEENLQNLAAKAGGVYFNEDKRDLLVNFFESSVDIEILQTTQTREDFIDLYPLFVVSAFVSFVVLIKIYN